MEKKQVVVYTMPTWPACVEIKRFLDDNQVDYQSKDITQDPVAKRELVQEFKSRGVPTTVVDGQVVVGFNEPELKKLLGMD